MFFAVNGRLCAARKSSGRPPASAKSSHPSAARVSAMFMPLITFRRCAPPSRQTSSYGAGTDLPQYAVDAVTNAQKLCSRLKVDVRCAFLHRICQQGIDQTHYRLAVFVALVDRLA